MRFRAPCWNICLLIALALMANVAHGLSFSVLQVESDFDSASGYQYTPVVFAGNPYSSGGITYHALSATDNSYSEHARAVRDLLLAAEGPANLTDIWCLNAVRDPTDTTSIDFLHSYVKTSSASTTAFQPSTISNVSNNIKIVNNSWVDRYTTDAANIDAIRRIDYMIHREDLVMVNGAVSPQGTPSVVLPLTWASRNGIAVRGTQTFDPSYFYSAGIGKIHADLWGPKVGDVDDVASYETPGVSGYAAALLKVADINGWSNGANGLRHEVVKSVLMTGADKTPAAQTTNGFNTSWTSNHVNNLDNVNGAGRANYAASLSVLNGGPHSMATVTNTDMTVKDPVVTTATTGWWYESALSGNGTEALIIDATHGSPTNLTATLAWDVTQTETEISPNHPRLDTTDLGVIFANLDLELRPVIRNGNTYTLGSSLNDARLMSKSTDDNVEHLYFTDSLASGYYAFVVSNQSDFAWNYGFSYRFAVVPEPGTLSLLAIAIVSMLCIRCARSLRRA